MIERKYFLFRHDRAGNEVYCSGMTSAGNVATTRYTGASTRRENRQDDRAGKPALQFSSARNAYEFAARHDALKYWRVGLRDVVDHVCGCDMNDLADVIDAWADAGVEVDTDCDDPEEIGVSMDRPDVQSIRALDDGMPASERAALLGKWEAPSRDFIDWPGPAESE